MRADISDTAGLRACTQAAYDIQYNEHGDAMNIIATEDIELLIAMENGQRDAVTRISEKQRHKMISMGFIRYTRDGYIITELGERMAKSLALAIS